MRKVLLCIFTFIFIVNACTETSPTGKMLEKADTLLTQEKHDSALILLKNINVGSLNEEEKYYNLLKTQTLYALYIPFTSDSTINSSINIFQKEGDKAKLARACYYKGAILYSYLKDTAQAVAITKKAEFLAKEINDYSLSGKIYNNLAKINSNAGNLNTALEYAKLALSCSYRTGEKSATCAALDRICYIFNAQDLLDSSFFYTKKTIPYIKYLRKEEQPGFLTNVSVGYYNKEYMKEALYYIKKSLDIRPTSHAYFLNGTILIEQGKDNEAWALWNKAKDTDNLALKTEIMQWMSDFKKEKGEYKEAILLADSINILKDSLKNKQKGESIIHIQKDIETNETDHRTHIRTITIVSLASTLIVILVLLIVFYAKRIRKAENIIAGNNKKIENYTSRLEDLTKSNKTNEREINLLKKKISDLREKNGEILGRGQKLWNDIMSGANTGLWHKSDYEAVIEYIQAKQPDITNNIKSHYRKLTASGTLYFVLKANGMDDAEIQNVMNMSAGALRTMKYRLKKHEL